MGFKCPVCKKDFKQKRDEWSDHCATAHFSIGANIVNILERATNQENGEKEDQNGSNHL